MRLKMSPSTNPQTHYPNDRGAHGAGILRALMPDYHRPDAPGAKHHPEWAADARSRRLSVFGRALLLVQAVLLLPLLLTTFVLYVVAMICGVLVVRFQLRTTRKGDRYTL